MKFAQDRGIEQDIQVIMDSVGVTLLDQQGYMTCIRALETIRR
jgi:hypothetical protein